MKVNPTAAYQAYNKVAEYNHAPRQTELRAEETSPKGEQHIDQIQISAEGARKMEIDQVSRHVLSQLREPASAERLDSLRNAVQSNAYHIPTADLVDSVMKFWSIA